MQSFSKVYNLTQDTNGKVTNSQLDTPNEVQEVSPFPAGDHKAHINRRAQRHSERFKPNLEFRYQIIVSSIKFRKGFASL